MARAGFGAAPQYSILSATSARLALCAGFLALAGCEGVVDGTGATRATGTGIMGASTSRMIERDVEAPEVFNQEEAGLWDGRPSLGGVWVAHPSVRDPERVMIRNAQTGETVVGALFRRERENPGPRFQISSEAANALGILPGQPTTIRVIALRLQQIETDPEPAAATDAATTDDADEAETAAAATGEAPQPDAPQQTERRGLRALFGSRQDAAPAPEVSETTAEDAPVIASPEPEPERRGLRAVFGRQPAEPAAPGITETPLAAPSPADAPTAPTTAATAQPAPAGRPEVRVEPAITPPTAADHAEPAPQERRGLRALFTRSSPDPAPGATATAPGEPLAPPTAADAPAADGPAPDRPFVQIGIFSVEGNANAARDRMRSAGLPAEIRRGRVDDRAFWRVVVGPARTEAIQAEMLRQVRGMGFADAYAVRR
ncbi:MAG: SPOR domain-containing protein [Pararhodobacter sp.]